mmetsp:Transcript_473/g.1462  ORF Transcript_473/g.1462 Transcript_473/m.1462 type:complete len:202 (+) Transcript_473:425-1030(+)
MPSSCSAMLKRTRRRTRRASREPLPVAVVVGSAKGSARKAQSQRPSASDKSPTKRSSSRHARLLTCRRGNSLHSSHFSGQEASSTCGTSIPQFTRPSAWAIAASPLRGAPPDISSVNQVPSTADINGIPPGETVQSKSTSAREAAHQPQGSVGGTTRIGRFCTRPPPLPLRRPLRACFAGLCSCEPAAGDAARGTANSRST